MNLDKRYSHLYTFRESIFIICFLIIVILLAYWGLNKLENQTRKETGEALQTILLTTDESLRLWKERNKRDIIAKAQNQELLEATEELLATPRNQEALLTNSALADVRNLLQPEIEQFGGLGIFIIAPDLISIASMRDENIGKINVIAQQRGDLLSRVFQGETLLIPPVESDVPLPDSTGQLISTPPTMFVATPIYEKDGDIIAVLTIRLDPNLDFYRITELGRIGKTGETYSFDQDGNLLAESRFEQHLHQIGLISSNERGINAIRIADPGGNLLDGFQPILPHEEQPLTLMAANATAGESGINVEGYRDYRGVTVFGAWLWDDELGFGLTTEIDAEEALQPYYDTRTIIFWIIGLTTLLSISLTIYVRHVRQQAIDKLQNTNTSLNIEISERKQVEKELKKHRDNLEELVVERTAKLQEEISERKQIEGELKEYRDHLEELVVDRTTELQQENNERRQTEIELRQAKKVAEVANQAKNSFLASMSHELRTPLNSVLGYTQIFKHDALLTEQHHHGIDVIHRSSEHLLEMINDILDLSKIEADRVELEPVKIHLLSFLQAIVYMIQLRAEQKGLFFSYQADADLPIAIFADEIRLRQILLNLLSNAVKFTEQGSVTLRVQRSENASGCKDEDKDCVQLRFEVEDSGIGIPLEWQDNIFESFYQVGDTLKKRQGTGLGLAISQKLVRLMGGGLCVESNDNGSRFWFTLPLSTSSSFGDTNMQSINQKTSYMRLTGTSPFRVLLVDDVAQNRDVLNILLISLGFVVCEAESGLGAIAKVKQFQPDLVIMDLVMPEMDGLEATRRIRRQMDHSQLPIIAHSASPGDEMRRESIAAGCDDFLPKPFKMEDVLEKLQRYLPLEWLHKTEDEIAQQDRVAPSEIEEVIPPPQEDIVELLSLSGIGDIKGIREYLKVLSKKNDQYTPFLAHVSRLAANFEIRKIQEYVQGYLE